MADAEHTFRQLVARWRAGEADAGDAIVRQVYGQLRAIAGRYFQSESPDHTLQPTAILDDALVQLLGQEDADWQDRRHFVAVAALAMRRALVDHARDRRRLKRGGGQWRVTLTDGKAPDGGSEVDLLDLDRALSRLAGVDPRKAELVQLRYFGGLPIPDAAAHLGISVATANRDWRLARAWLFRALHDG